MMDWSRLVYTSGSGALSIASARIGPTTPTIRKKRTGPSVPSGELNENRRPIGILVGPELPGGGPVDDRDRLAPVVVGREKVAAPFERDPHGREVVARDHPRGDVRGLAVG